MRAMHQLGFTPLMMNVLYRFGLKSGWLSRQVTGKVTLSAKQAWDLEPRYDLISIPQPSDIYSCIDDDGRAQLLKEADEIKSGLFRRFGGEAVALDLSAAGSADWIVYERGGLNGLNLGIPHEDIKYVWEAGRFAWALTLARAFHISGDRSYCDTFWKFSDQFFKANPACRGLHWCSGQEVALRIINLSLAYQVFGLSPEATQDRRRSLAVRLAEHAARIPPGLIYARSQENNHLLSEAAGLYTAGLILPKHPQASAWREMGWHWFITGLTQQIDNDGCYTQHSTNYHRLMLHLALWVNLLAGHAADRFPIALQERLQAATQWLFALMDGSNGRVPNLGHNDGAYIFPLSVCPYEDYRPVLQAASRTFTGRECSSKGKWNEMSLWLSPGIGSVDFKSEEERGRKTPHVLSAGDDLGWAYLRCAHFDSRPAHADQNHVDLWWKGINLAQDAGTYLYNTPAPWKNALMAACYHNTVTLENTDQMRRAGRFLYLDWAQGQFLG